MTDPETETPTLRFTIGGNGTGKRIVINTEFLSQYEFRQMAKAYEQLSAFGLPPYSAVSGRVTTHSKSAIRATAPSTMKDAA